MQATFIGGLTELLASGENLPTLPHVVLEVHSALDNELVSSGQIADIIEKDPALTTRLLRMANSAYFGGGRERVAGVTEAIARMGLGQVRATCLVLAVVKTFAPRGHGLDHNRFWAHSAYCGMVAQRLWRLAGRTSYGEASARVYVCGLLHDVGLLVLDQFFPDEFSRNLELARESESELWRVEEDELGMDHGEIGGLLLGRWQLPAAVAEVVTNHHRPERASEEAGEIAKFVHAAEIVASLSPTTGRFEGLPRLDPAEVVVDLGFSPDDVPELMANLKELEGEAAGFSGMAG